MGGWGRGVLGLVLMAALLGGCDRTPRLTLAGGSAGSTLETYAAGLAELYNQHLEDARLVVERSGGSVVNLRRLEQGQVDMALVFAGDAWLGSQPQNSENIPRIVTGRAVVRLYGSVAQLIVRRGSPYQRPRDLLHARVAVGSPGSGSALSARRFLTRLGLWEQITPIYLSPIDGLEELSHGRVEAVWAMVGYPDPQLRDFSRDVPVRLLSLYDEAVTSGFFQDYPFYGTTRLMGGGYDGQDGETVTFQDGVLWLARPEVPADYVYRALKLLFSRTGQRQLREISPVALELDPLRGRMGVRVPLHPGAERFWREFEAARFQGQE